MARNLVLAQFCLESWLQIWVYWAPNQAAMDKSDFNFRYPLRVRWAETDMQGVVFNGHYLTYFDVAITEYWRATGYPYPSTLEHFGVDLYVVKASLEYHAPARYDDLLEVYARVGRLGNSSIQYLLGIFRGQDHLVSGEVIYVTADPQTRKSVRVPEALREAIAALENKPGEA